MSASRIISSIIAPNNPESDAIAETLTADILEVFDGDGFLANLRGPFGEVWVNRVPIRFAFIDAPEMDQPFGVESRKFLQKLIRGKALQLCLIGKESTNFVPIDQYKRILCMAFLIEQMPIGKIDYYVSGNCGTGLVRAARSVTRNIELEMIINGWAWVMKQYAFEREQEYLGAQDDAQRNRRGLWSMDNPEPPWVFKRRQKRQTKAEASQPSLFSSTNSQCPTAGCSGHLIDRKGDRGSFLGCSSFPRCRYSQTS
ncbi:thermonuclease family protein [Parasphingorhabdus sp.]|uniref:thermonuclease family protein n=1 Tax=Parasphingorhabdus sp. TaxID=2709688 RepID=UPI003A90E41D